MRDPKKPRLDYMPGPLAEECLAAARNREPRLSQQALIDKLVILGSWAQTVQLHPPVLFGANRKRWRLPGSGTSPSRRGEEEP